MIFFFIALSLASFSDYHELALVEQGYIKLGAYLNDRKPLRRKRVYRSKYLSHLNPSQILEYRLRMEMNYLSFAQMDRVVEQEGWLNTGVQ